MTHTYNTPAAYYREVARQTIRLENDRRDDPGTRSYIPLNERELIEMAFGCVDGTCPGVDFDSGPDEEEIQIVRNVVQALR